MFGHLGPQQSNRRSVLQSAHSAPPAEACQGEKREDRKQRGSCRSQRARFARRPSAGSEPATELRARGARRGRADATLSAAEARAGGAAGSEPAAVEPASPVPSAAKPAGPTPSAAEPRARGSVHCSDRSPDPAGGKPAGDAQHCNGCRLARYSGPSTSSLACIAPERRSKCSTKINDASSSPRFSNCRQSMFLTKNASSRGTPGRSSKCAAPS